MSVRPSDSEVTELLTKAVFTRSKETVTISGELLYQLLSELSQVRREKENHK